MMADLKTRMEVASVFWGQFDLDSKRLVLDQQSLEMADAQKNGVASRKKLAEGTRTFRRSPEETKTKVVGPLLKQYQGEIDKLTRRSRFAETSFLTLYKSLFEAPNPHPIIRQALEQISKSSSSNSEVARLEKEIAEYESEIAGLHNQDITIRSLEARIESMQEEQEATIVAAIEAAKEKMQNDAKTRTAKVAEVDENLVTQLEEAQSALEQSQQMNDAAQNQIFELRSVLEDKEQSGANTDADDEGATSEGHLLDGSDIDGGSTRMQALERECANLRDQLEDQRAMLARGALDSAQRDRVKIHELEEQLRQRDTQLEDMRIDITRAQAEATKARQQGLDKVEESERMVENIRNELDDCVKARDARPTEEQFVAVKRKLKMLQAIEFNIDESDDEGMSSTLAAPTHGSTEFGNNPENTETMPAANQKTINNGGGGRSEREIMLFARVRKLEGVASTLRVEAEAVRKSLEVEQHALELTTTELSIAKETIEKLEIENENVSVSVQQQQPRGRNDSGSVVNSTDAKQVGAKGLSNEGHGVVGEASSALLQQVLGNNESEQSASERASENIAVNHPAGLSEKVLQHHQSSGVVNGSGTQDGGDNTSMVNILDEQRKRFRQRVLELESKRDALAADMTKQQQTSEQLRSDNVKLYEQIKYLQSYKNNNNMGRMRAHSNSRSGNMNGGANIIHDVEAGEDVESRYRALYEKQMNPFQDFNMRERRKRIKGLSLAEKATLSATKFVVHNKYTRSFVFFYVVALHLLVMSSMWWLTHNSFKRCTHLTHGGLAAAQAHAAASGGGDGIDPFARVGMRALP